MKGRLIAILMSEVDNAKAKSH
jgi:hypothetical protein